MLPAGGSVATESDGKPLHVEGSTCRAVLGDISRQCQRRGWFAIREVDGSVVRPLCATHLRSLAASGGPVIGGRD